MPFRYELNLYTTIPTRTAAGTLSLARAVIVAAPEQPIDPIVKRLTNVHQKALTLQTAWIDANRPSSSSESRSADRSLDRLWSATRSRLQDWVNSDDPVHRKRAQELLDLLFPTGLDFLSLPFAKQWSESDRRLALIKSDGLEPDLIDLCDKRFVIRLHAAHIAYGEVLDITKKKPELATTRVIDALRALRTELAAYARLILGLTDEDDEQAVAIAEAALEPIHRYRKPRSTSEAEAEAEEEAAAEPIDAPLPDVPEGA